MNEDLNNLVLELEAKLHTNERTISDLNELNNNEKHKRIRSIQEENILLRNCIAALKTDIIYNTDFHELLLREYRIKRLSNRIDYLKEERRKTAPFKRKEINKEIKDDETELKTLKKLR